MSGRNLDECIHVADVDEWMCRLLTWHNYVDKNLNEWVHVTSDVSQDEWACVSILTPAKFRHVYN